jgi:hypothetical protein
VRSPEAPKMTTVSGGVEATLMSFHGPWIVTGELSVRICSYPSDPGALENQR